MTPLDRDGEIRTAEPTDRDEIMQVLASSGLFSPDEISDVRATLDVFLRGGAGQDRWLIGRVDDHVAAVAYFAPERMTDGTWNLYLLAVHPDQQRHGLGAALVRRAEQDLVRFGARVLLIETSGVPEFAGQRAFYERLGYSVEARIRDFYAAGDDKIVFWKKLPAVASR